MAVGSSLRGTFLLAVAALVLGSVLVSARARADSFLVDQYDAAPVATDGFALARPDDLGHLRLGAVLHLSYAHDPLVYQRVLGDASTELGLVRHDLVAHVGLAFGLFERLVLFAQAPVGLELGGEGLPADAPAAAVLPAYGHSPTISYLPVGARLRLFGRRGERGLHLGVQVAARVPLADRAYRGDSGFVLVPKLLAELDFGVRITVNVGARIRSERELLNLRVPTELVGGLGVTIPLVPSTLDAHLEAFGATAVTNVFGRESSPFEALAGVQVHPADGLVVGGAAGIGLSAGYGAPDYRLVLLVGYANAGVPSVPATGDVDEAPAVPNPVEGCPGLPAGIPMPPEGQPCPEPDRDGDAVPDARDGAPDEPEDRDGFEDENGIPEPDDDLDGVLDAADQCRQVAEDRDGIDDDDGCPEADVDNDQIPDTDDHCPRTPGVANSEHPECTGCPALACQNASGTIVILDRVEFAEGQDVILERSFPVLQAVQQILETNANIRRVRVEGHTDDRGNDAENLALSQRRARSVMRWLVEHGVAAERLESEGYGETRPIASNRRRPGRAANRRVEFHIVDPAPPGGEASPGATPDAR